MIEENVIKITNNGKCTIKKIIKKAISQLNTEKKIKMQAEDKSISKLITIVEIIKQ